MAVMMSIDEANRLGLDYRVYPYSGQAEVKEDFLVDRLRSITEDLRETYSEVVSLKMKNEILLKALVGKRGY